MNTNKKANFIALLVGIFSVFNLVAQDALGPMGGVGGEMRRSEGRVIAPSVPSNKGKQQAPVIAPAVPETDKAAPVGPVWDIEIITLTGDLSFAGEYGVKEILEKELLAGEPKNRQQVQDTLRDLYRKFIDDGYYLARATLPRKPYDAATKTLTVLVEEGLFGDVNISFKSDREDGLWFSRKQISRRFSNISSNETFNYKLLHKNLSNINAHPDLTLDAQIKVRKPIVGEGEDRRVVRYADIDLVVDDSIPFHAVLDVNNYAMETVDEWQTALTLQYLNLTKHDDVLTLSPAMTFDSSLISLAGSYMRPHEWWKGGATTVYAGYSYLQADDIVPDISLEGTGYFLGAVQSYKLIDDDERLLSISGSLVYRYIEDQFSAFSTTLQQRDVSVLPLSIALSYSGRRADAFRGRNFATLQGIYNLTAGGSNELDDLWVGAEENYMIGRLQLARLQPLFGELDSMERQVHQWILFMKAEGQYASCPLIAAEKLALGGHNTIRGYTKKGYLGDNGIYGTLELRTPILLDFFSNTFGRKTSNNPLDRLQFVAFTDVGYIEFIDPLPGVEESEVLMSVGGGVRIAVTKYSQLRLDVGVPVASGTGDDDASAYYLDWQLQF